MPRICGVCTRVAASYTCPRCQVAYCGLDCYKGHGGQKCSESFYQAQVEEELHSQRASEPERKKLERVVAGLANLGSADDAGEEDSDDEQEAQRLSALVERAEQGTLDIQDLTDEEARRFHSELKRGVLGQALAVWEPWWQRAAVLEADSFQAMPMQEECPVVEFDLTAEDWIMAGRCLKTAMSSAFEKRQAALEETFKSANDGKVTFISAKGHEMDLDSEVQVQYTEEDLPIHIKMEVNLDSLDEDVPSDIPGVPAVVREPPAHICCAAGREAHPAVALTVLEVLYAYAHTMRTYNGDWAWDPIQAALHLLHFASTVCSRKVYDSFGECVRSVLAAGAALPRGDLSPDLDMLCLADLTELLQRGLGSAAMALRDVGELIGRAAAAAEERRGSGGKAVGKLRRGEKKVEFLISFASHHEDVLMLVAPQVKTFELERRKESRARQEEVDCRASGGVALPPR